MRRYLSQFEDYVRRELLHYVFDRVAKPALREAVRYSGVPSVKVRCDVCRGPFPSHVHVCDECRARGISSDTR